MSNALKDKRLEAAAQIINGEWGGDADDLELARHNVSLPGTGGLELLQSALRVTGADEMAEALEDMLSGWRYIKQVYGALDGVGWVGCEKSATAALAKYKELKNV